MVFYGAEAESSSGSPMAPWLLESHHKVQTSLDYKTLSKKTKVPEKRRPELVSENVKGGFICGSLYGMTSGS